MKFRWAALACDYDGTLASGGHVSASTLEALAQVRCSRRKLLLVTGRELPDLFKVCPFVEIFDRVVAENGALIYNPANGRPRLLARPPSRQLIGALREHKVEPLSVGRAVIATLRGQRRVVSRTIEELGLPLEVILNKRSLMVLPRGVNKASGLLDALRELRVSPENTIGVGDGENDEDFLAVCGYSAAVANALPGLKRNVDVVTSASYGGGVAELVKNLLNGGPIRHG
jgi:hydroxymethylpyrimidine pyrophosphatase-like HAD family hydrolase